MQIFIKIYILEPFQGPCCTDHCTLKRGDKCRDDNGCRDSAFCNGRTPHCPASVNKPNKTICNEEFVCYKGVRLSAAVSHLLVTRYNNRVFLFRSARVQSV